MTYTPQQEQFPPEKAKKTYLPWLLGGLALGALLLCGFFMVILVIILPRFLSTQISSASNAPEHGIKMVFQAQISNGKNPSSEEMQQGITILSDRAKSLGLKSYSFQVSGRNRIIALLPKNDLPEELMKNLFQTGLVEFVDMRDDCLQEGTEIVTDFLDPSPFILDRKYPHTIFSGEQIRSAAVTTDYLGKYVVAIELDEKGTNILSEHSKNNAGKCLAITLDKRIITDPRINTTIPDGKAIIEGNFSQESANRLAMYMRYKALPFPLVIIETSEY